MSAALCQGGLHMSLIYGETSEGGVSYRSDMHTLFYSTLKHSLVLQFPLMIAIVICHVFSFHWLLQGHQIEVRSSGGGHIRGIGTIHGNVDIITSGNGVSTPLQEH